jgi:gliding motility-associated-like protein
MKLLVTVLFLFFYMLQPVAAQNLLSRWQYGWGGNYQDYLANIIPLPGNQYLFGGSSRSDPNCTKSSICYGSDDMVIFVLDDNGNKIWEKSYGGTYSDKLWDVKKVPAGGFILVGETGSPPSGIKTSPQYGKSDIWIVRIDDAGNLLWEKTFGSAEYERAKKVIPTADGGFLIAGDYSSGNFNIKDYLALKIDAAGNSMWSRKYSGSNNDILWDVLPMPNGNFLLSGSSNSPAGGDKTAPQYGSYDQWIICIQPDGAMLWDKTYGTSNDDYENTLLPLIDGNYLITGNENSNTGILRKIDPQGNELWVRSCGPGIFRLSSQAANGDIYVAGESTFGVRGCKTSPAVGTSVDYWITVFDAAGNKIGDMDYGGIADDEFITDIKVVDRDVWLIGGSNSGISGNKTVPVCGYSDGWIIRLSPKLFIIPPTPVDLCSNNNSFIVYFSSSSLHQQGNVFTVQLSDATGSFSTYTNIGAAIASPNMFKTIFANLPANLPASDNYKLRLISSLPADTSSGYAIKIQGLPVVNLGNDTTICNNIPLTLTTGSRSPGDLFLWNDGSTGNSLIVSTADAYSCTVQNNCGTAADAIQISTQLAPVADIGNDRSFCEGTTITLQSTIQLADVSYLWNNGAVTSNLVVETGGTYWLHTTNVCGTTGDTVLVTMDPKPVSQLNKDTILCFGSSRVLDAGAGHADYLWNDGQGGETRTVSEPGEYWVQITGNNGCITRDTANIKRIVPLPAGFLPADTALCAYEDLTLKSSIPFSQYEWSTGDVYPFIQVSIPGLYFLLGTDRYGCSGKDSILISGKQCPYGFFMPSAFSPNNDGKNDGCRPSIFGKISKYHFSIFNRWGQKVFDSYNYTQRWDGTINGRLADAGTYVWSCLYQLNTKAEQYAKGTVVLIR